MQQSDYTLEQLNRSIENSWESNKIKKVFINLSDLTLSETPSSEVVESISNGYTLIVYCTLDDDNQGYAIGNVLLDASVHKLDIIFRSRRYLIQVGNSWNRSWITSRPIGGAEILDCEVHNLSNNGGIWLGMSSFSISSITPDVLRESLEGGTSYMFSISHLDPNDAAVIGLLPVSVTFNDDRTECNLSVIINNVYTEIYIPDNAKSWDNIGLTNYPINNYLSVICNIVPIYNQEGDWNGISSFSANFQPGNIANYIKNDNFKKFNEKIRFLNYDIVGSSENYARGEICSTVTLDERNSILHITLLIQEMISVIEVSTLEGWGGARVKNYNLSLLQGKYETSLQNSRDWNWRIERDKLVINLKSGKFRVEPTGAPWTSYTVVFAGYNMTNFPEGAFADAPALFGEADANEWVKFIPICSAVGGDVNGNPNTALTTHATLGIALHYSETGEAGQEESPYVPHMYYSGAYLAVMFTKTTMIVRYEDGTISEESLSGGNYSLDFPGGTYSIPLMYPNE